MKNINSKYFFKNITKQNFKFENIDLEMLDTLQFHPLVILVNERVCEKEVIRIIPKAFQFL